jgi:hypothetical protein
MQAPLPPGEAARLEALQRYKVLDTPRETDFDDLVRLAAYICQTPISLVSLVDRDRQWFKGRYGLELAETPRRLSFCAHSILQAPAMTHVPDATRDPRFADNELVTGAPGIRFYAAAPLVIGNSVFITSNYNRGCTLLEIADGKATAKWENKEICSHFNSPLYYDGSIYCTSDPGKLVCLDPATGTPRWTKQGFEKGGLMSVDGTLIVMDGRTGDVVMVKLNAEKYEELGRFKPLGGQSWTAPIVANGKLIIRNKTTLACYDLAVPKN